VQLRRACQVWPEMRCASAHLLAYIEDGFWLRLTAVSNVVGARIAVRLRLFAPANANLLFIETQSQVLGVLQQGEFLFRRSRSLACLVNATCNRMRFRRRTPPCHRT
jgi:threonine aldolase